MSNEYTEAFLSGDFTKHLNINNSRGTKRGRGRPRKNQESGVLGDSNTNFFRYINDGSGDSYLDNDYSGYLHYGGERIHPSRRTDFLAYIPDVGADRRESEESGIKGLHKGLDREERLGKEGYYKVKGAVKRARENRTDQKILSEQKQATRYEAWKERRIVKKLLKNEKEYHQKKSEPEQQQDVGQAVPKEKNKSPVQPQASNTSRSPIKAAHGFHGFVDHPTYFLVGEEGPERVDVTPMRKGQKGDPFDILNIGAKYMNGGLG